MLTVWLFLKLDPVRTPDHKPVTCITASTSDLLANQNQEINSAVVGPIGKLLQIETITRDLFTCPE